MPSQVFTTLEFLVALETLRLQFQKSILNHDRTCLYRFFSSVPKFLEFRNRCLAVSGNKKDKTRAVTLGARVNEHRDQVLDSMVGQQWAD